MESAGKKEKGSPKKKGGPGRFYWLRAVRILVAVAVLLSFTVVFIDYRRLVEGWFFEGLASTQIVPAWQNLLSGVTVVALLVFSIFIVGTLLFGRVYCSFLCPFGIMQDVVSRIARKFKKGRNKAYKYAKPVKWVRQAVVGAVALASLLGFGSVAWAWLDPYSQFGRFANMFLRPLLIEGNNAVAGMMDKPSHWLYALPPGWPHWNWVLVPMVLLVLVAVVFAALRGRLYCNTICPVGAVLGFLSRFSMFRMSIDRGACVKCALCMKSCKSQCIDLKTSSIDQSRCVNCFDCVSVCDGMAINYRFAWRKQGKGGNNHKLKDILPPPPEQTPSQGSPVMVSMADATRRSFLGMTLVGIVTSLVSCAEKKSDGFLKAKRNPRAISPPGSGTITEFFDSCTGCQLCVAACPGTCLKPSYMEYGATGMFKPRMDFKDGFCQFECTTCSHVCPAGAIKPMDKEQKIVTAVGKADLDLRHCIAANDKTDCGACAEHCPKGALEMVRFTQPVLNRGNCISCLKCKGVCPTGAITYEGERRKTPVIDYKKCIGCGKCVAVCANEGIALTMAPSQWDIRVPVLHAEYCIGCGGCEYICPPRTITVKGLETHETANTIVEEKLKNPNEGVDFPF